MRRRINSGLAAPELVCELPRRRTGTLLTTISTAVLLLGGCASSSGVVTASNDTFDTKWGVSSSQRVHDSGPIPKGGGHYKLGRPYQIGGRWYVPRHEPSYDRQGVGSWYGKEFHGRKTANGEVFDMDAITAAHPTLPLPSYAYVTNMRNGRTILVRINDRGPYVANREIDLSRASARALGYADGGLGQVRVRWAGHAPLNGDDSREQAFLRDQRWNGGGPAVARFDRPAEPLPERRDRQPQRYAQDMNRQVDSGYEQPYGRYDQHRGDANRYNDAHYDAARGNDGFEDQYSGRQGGRDTKEPRQDRRAGNYSERTSDAYQAGPPRPYAPEEPEAAEVPREPRRPAPADQAWSPFDHRQQSASSVRR